MVKQSLQSFQMLVRGSVCRMCQCVCSSMHATCHAIPHGTLRLPPHTAPCGTVFLSQHLGLFVVACAASSASKVMSLVSRPRQFCAAFWPFDCGGGVDGIVRGLGPGTELCAMASASLPYTVWCNAHMLHVSGASLPAACAQNQDSCGNSLCTRARICIQVWLQHHQLAACRACSCSLSCERCEDDAQ